MKSSQILQSISDFILSYDYNGTLYDDDNGTLYDGTLEDDDHGTLYDDDK